MLRVALLLLVVQPSTIAAFDQECPRDCYCHTIRDNFVTDCSEGNLSMVPYDELSPKVVILDLNGNGILNLDPFPEGTEVERLQLARNGLTRLTRMMFLGLEHLTEVDVSENLIGDVQVDSFRDSPAMTTLELQHNPLTPAGDGPLLNCPSLLFLDISNCSLTELGDEFFVGTPFISYLDLSGNPLGALRAAVFEPLVMLQELKLNRCGLNALGTQVLLKQFSLKVLEVRGNPLADVSWIFSLGNLFQMENLGRKLTRLKNYPEKVFVGNPVIRCVLLAEREFSVLDARTSLGERLRRLYAMEPSQCEEKSSVEDTAFAKSLSLKILDLSDVRLWSSNLATSLTPLTGLESLLIRNCSLTRLPQYTFETLAQLKELDMSWNPLTGLQNRLLRPLANLEYLNMAHINVTWLSNDTFHGLDCLRKLILTGNKLRGLQATLFASLTNLDSLEIDNCGLKKALDNEVFALPRLRQLKMSGNSLGGEIFYIPLNLASLKVLDASRCNISRLSEESFTHSSGLRRLLLANNKLNSRILLSSFSSKHLAGLEYLDLSENNLTTPVVSNIREVLPRLADVDLTGNPWVCSCGLSEWWNWAASRNNLAHLAGAAADEAAKEGRKALLCSDSGSWVTWERYLTSKKCRIQTVREVKQSELYGVLAEYRSSPWMLPESPPESDGHWATAAWSLIITALAGALLASIYLSIRIVGSKTSEQTAL